MKKNLVIFIIDSLIGGGAEKSCLRIAKELTLFHNITTKFIIFDNIINYDIDFDTEIISIKSKEIEKKYPRFLSFSKFKKYSEIIKNKIKEFEDKESLKTSLIFSNLKQSHKACSYIEQNNIYYFIRNNQTEQQKLNTKPKIEKLRRILKLKKLYKNKNLICVSKGIEIDLLQNFKIKPKSIQTIYNYYDFEDIILKSQEKLNDEVFKQEYLVNIASFKNQKNLPRLIEAFYLANLDTKLILIGKGSDSILKDLKQMVKNYKIEHKVIFYGFSNQPYPILKNAKLFILSSDFEGLPNVVMESLICGTPVASTNCPSGPSEILTGDMKRGLSELNAQDLAKKIKDIYENPYKIDFDYLKKNFHMKNIAQKYLNLI